MSFSDRFHESDGRMGPVTRAALSLTVGALIFVTADRLLASRDRTFSPTDAPRRTLRGGRPRGWRESTVVGRTVTINRPRADLYAFWRDFKNLPRFMENVLSADVIDDKRSRWTIAGPGGANIEFDAMITDERPGELIAWESAPDAPVRNSGRIVFRDSPGGRGTEVEATIAYDPPAGTIGRLAAKIFQREPNIQARRELKRFKQLMETGEIATAERARSHPDA